MTRPQSRGRGARIDQLSQRTRRIVAAATLLGLPSMFLWSQWWMSTDVPSLVWGPITFLLIGVTVVGSFVLYRYIRHRADFPGAGLDERERQLRDHAWILSYQILSLVVILAVIVAGISVFLLGQTIVVDAALVNALVLCVAVLLPVLPAAALAWIEPDAPADA